MQELVVVVRDGSSQVLITFEIIGGVVSNFSMEASGWDRHYPNWTSGRYHPQRVLGCEVHAFVYWLLDLEELDGYQHYVLTQPPRQHTVCLTLLAMLFAVYASFKPSWHSSENSLYMSPEDFADTLRWTTSSDS